MSQPHVILLQPPSPPRMNVSRDWQGTFGVATRVRRNCYGHENPLNVVPSSVFLHCLAALEEAGAAVSFVDAQVEQLDLPDVLRRVGSHQPDLLVAAVCLPSLEGDLHLLDAIKHHFPHVTIATAGAPSRVLHEVILARAGAIDAVVVGDPEVTLCPLAQQLQQSGGELHVVPGVATRWHLERGQQPAPAHLSDFSSLPRVAWHLLPLGKYYSTELGDPRPYATIMASRGCPYPCGYYCPYPTGFGSKFLRRDPRIVGEELEAAVRHYGREIILFRDQVFSHNRDHAAAVCEEILTRGLNVHWFCETRMDRVDSELLRLMRRAGCFAVHYGLESGDPEMLATFAKPGVDLDRAAEAIRRTREAGIRAHCHVLLGLPDETEEALRATARVLRHLHPDTVNMTWLTPYPGTQFWEVARQDNLLLVSGDDFRSLTGCNMVVRTHKLGPAELKRAYRRLVFATAGWRMRDAIRKAVARFHAMLYSRRIRSPRQV